MAKVHVYNLDREKVGELDLADYVFGGEVNEALFYDVVKAQLASRRAGTHKVKDRAEVRGTTRRCTGRRAPAAHDTVRRRRPFPRRRQGLPPSLGTTPTARRATCGWARSGAR